MKSLISSIYPQSFNACQTLDDGSYFFTSLHIPEADGWISLDQWHSFVNLCQKKGLRPIVDISPLALRRLNMDSLAQFVSTYPFFVSRLDVGFTSQDVAQASSLAPLACNLSTADIFEGAHLGIHNFYPRPETGLDPDQFILKNQLARKHHLPIFAFISGDEKRRGPLYQGLVTLEDHRLKNPYVQYVDMVKKYQIDQVILGDMGLSRRARERIDRFNARCVIELQAELELKYTYLYGQIFHNRSDSPKWLIRVVESRSYASKGTLSVNPENIQDRPMGTITMDNDSYLRYAGEIQIMRKDFPSDSRVNCIGRIVEEDLDLLSLLDFSQAFCFIPHL